jgi:hypothetical protein
LTERIVPVQLKGTALTEGGMHMDDVLLDIDNDALSTRVHPGSRRS